MRTLIIGTWDRSPSRHGYFGHFEIAGIRYESRCGDIAWHIVMRHRSIYHYHHYWVVDGTFHDVSMNYDPNRGTIAEITPLTACRTCQELAVPMSELVVNISPEERRSALGAIAEWEIPIQHGEPIHPAHITESPSVR